MTIRHCTLGKHWPRAQAWGPMVKAQGRGWPVESGEASHHWLSELAAPKPWRVLRATLGGDRGDAPLR